MGAVALPPAPPAQAETLIGAEAAKRKINLAGRQRMLSQRMAMLACMADSDVQTENALARADAAHDLFDRTLQGLRFGDEELGQCPGGRGAARKVVGGQCEGDVTGRRISPQ